MLIYRYEHPVTKIGPYENIRFNHDDTAHPGPYADEISIPSQDSKFKLFGCSTKKILNSWFNSADRDAMREKGYLLNLYKVNKAYVLIGKSGKQVVFDARKAKLVKSLTY